MVGISYKTDSETEQEHWSPKETILLEKKKKKESKKDVFNRNTLLCEVLHSLARDSPACHPSIMGRQSSLRDVKNPQITQPHLLTGLS